MNLDLKDDCKRILFNFEDLIFHINFLIFSKEKEEMNKSHYQYLKAKKTFFFFLLFYLNY